MRCASLWEIKLDGTNLATYLFLNKLLKNLACAGKRNVTKGVNLSAAKSLADVSAVSESYSLGNRYENCGMFFKCLIDG